MLYIPKEFMVGFQRRINRHGLDIDTDVDNEYVLGFATYRDEKGKIRCEKSWNSWKHDENPVLTFQNDALSGFKIIGYETRTSGSWNSTGRSVFDVEDPRGFVLQINSGNLIEIVRQCSMTQGVISTPCLWSWDGQNIILVPEGTDLYKEGVESFRLKNQKISIKDLNPGDRIKLQNGEIGTWFGGQYIVENKPYADNQKDECIIGGQKRKYIFLQDEIKTWGGSRKNHLSISSSFKISEVIEKADPALTPQQVSDLLNKHVESEAKRKVLNREKSYQDLHKSTLDKWDYDWGFWNCLFFSDKKIKDEDKIIESVSSLRNKDDWHILMWDRLTAENRQAKVRADKKRRLGW